jgi:hypothetical protein
MRRHGENGYSYAVIFVLISLPCHSSLPNAPTSSRGEQAEMKYKAQEE